MSLFMLETEVVTSSKSTMDSIASQITNIASAVNSYDTSCDDFDFASAKSVIAGNIEAFGAKVKNTGAVMESVVSSHTALQNSLKFGAQSAEQQQEQNPTEQNPTEENPVGGPSGENPIGNNDGGYNGGGNNGGGSNYYPIVVDNPVTDNDDSIQEVKEKVTKISHAKVDTEKLTADGKKILESATYNRLGYAMYAGMLVIACSSTIGKVGDVIEFVLTDGSKVRCIIGENIEETGEIRFFIDDKWKEDAEENIGDDFVSKIDKIYNYGTSGGSDGIIDIVNLPAIGEHTSKWNTLGEDWTVVTTKTNVPGYASYVKGKISQNANQELFNDKCLSFAETHAYALYTGNTGDSAVQASGYPHSSSFKSWYSDSKEETLLKVYSEIVNGRPVVIQVNGNPEGTSRHFVTVVGFRNSVTDPNALTEKDLLIIDSWDGQTERMDQSGSRFLTNGAQCGKDYSGYYLRILKTE